MLRLLLIAVLALFILWFLRRFCRAFLFGEAPPARRAAGAEGEKRQKPLDLVRDEKTGEYRVKED